MAQAALREAPILEDLNVNSPADSTARLMLALPECVLHILHPHNVLRAIIYWAFTMCQEEIPNPFLHNI